MFGLPINIEVKAGRYRIKRNRDPHLMPADYGEIEGTKGADKDPIDVFVGVFPESEEIFIINKRNDDGTFDEHKVMLGFYNRKDAEEHYRLAYTRSNLSPNDVVSVTETQFKWWLKKARKDIPVTPASFPFDPNNKEVSTTMTETIYDWTNGDESKIAAKVIYDMRGTDKTEELLEPLDFDDFVSELEQDGEVLEGAQQAAFDALVVQNRVLPRKMQLVGKALNRAGSDLKVVDEGVKVSEPYKSRGITMVGAVFELTDGQTISILFHNKDTTPNRLSPDDNLIAWRWLLNRKDITIVVAKENGKDQNINSIARKVMILAEKNSRRFVEANKKRQERAAAVQAAKDEITQLEETLKQRIEERDALKQGIQDWKDGKRTKAVEPEENPAPDTVGEEGNTEGNAAPEDETPADIPEGVSETNEGETPEPDVTPEEPEAVEGGEEGKADEGNQEPTDESPALPPTPETETPEDDTPPSPTPSEGEAPENMEGDNPPTEGGDDPESGNEAPAPESEPDDGAGEGGTAEDKPVEDNPNTEEPVNAVPAPEGADENDPANAPDPDNVDGNIPADDNGEPDVNIDPDVKLLQDVLDTQVDFQAIMNDPTDENMEYLEKLEAAIDKLKDVEEHKELVEKVNEYILAQTVESAKAAQEQMGGNK